MIPLNGNSTSIALSNGVTFTGEWFNAIFYQGHETIIVTAKTDRSGILYVDFSPDGTNSDRTLAFDVAASTSELHRLTIVNQFFRVRFYNNSGSGQTYLRLQTVLSNNSLMGIPLNVSMQPDTDAIPVKAVLHGQTDSGAFLKVPVDSNGHLEQAIHGPLLPFGSVHTERLEPILQADAIYGLNSSNHRTILNASGTAAASDSAFVCTTGTTIYGAGSIQSRERLIYRPGQGMVFRFTGLFTTGVANSYQLVGFGHGEDGLWVGYKGTQFGIVYNSRGKREVRTLTISTKSSTAENAVVTLNGTAFSVAVTNGANTIQTAWEIAQGTYTGWEAEAIGSTVVFVSNAVGVKAGVFTISGTTVVGSFAQTSAGQAVTEMFVAQADFNGDTLDGSGNSDFVADWTKFNVFQFGVQYLGAGAIICKIEIPHTGNNPTWVTFHTLDLPNTLIKTSFGNPTFPFTMSAYSAGSTTDLTIKCGSYSAFIEGERKVHGDRFSYTNTLTTAGATNFQCLFTLRNTRYFGGRTNQTVIKVLSVFAALKHTSPCTIYLFRNATLAGVPNFTTWSTNSCALYDSSATTCTIASNNQLIWSGTLGDTGNLDYQFIVDEVRIQPGETITLAAKSAFGTPSYVVGGLNTKEYQ